MGIINGRFFDFRTTWISKVVVNCEGKIKKIDVDKEYSSENIEKMSIKEIEKQIQQFQQETDINIQK